MNQHETTPTKSWNKRSHSSPAPSEKTNLFDNTNTNSTGSALALTLGVVKASWLAAICGGEIPCRLTNLYNREDLFSTFPSGGVTRYGVTPPESTFHQSRYKKANYFTRFNSEWKTYGLKNPKIAHRNFFHHDHPNFKGMQQRQRKYFHLSNLWQGSSWIQAYYCYKVDGCTNWTFIKWFQARFRLKSGPVFNGGVTWNIKSTRCVWFN